MSRSTAFLLAALLTSGLALACGVGEDEAQTSGAIANEGEAPGAHAALEDPALAEAAETEDDEAESDAIAGTDTSADTAAEAAPAPRRQSAPERAARAHDKTAKRVYDAHRRAVKRVFGR